jgi:hypothetical protein
MIISASPSYAGPSGVTTETEKLFRSAMGYAAAPDICFARSTAPSIGPTM